MGHYIEANRAVLSSTEASQVSGLARPHIHYLIQQGILDAVRVGYTWLVYEDSLKRYLASPRKPGPKPKHAGPLDVSSMPESKASEAG